MATVPAKVTDRFRSNLNKIQKVIEQAKVRDINEADTVVIVSDILTDIFGYDKYSDITREYAIKNTYCDLAIKVDGNLKFLIEVKSIGTTLAEKHYQQALDYGANNGTEWIVLTNGLVWKIYKVRFEKPIHTDLVCEFNMTELKLKNTNDIDKLFILCKEGLKKNAIDEFTQHKMVVNKYYIGAIIQSDSVLEVVKKELKKIDVLLKVETEEVKTLIINDVMKRELLESPDALDASDKYNKIIRKLEKKKVKSKVSEKSDEEDNKDIPKETPVETIENVE
jgi:predicted type IV restriction endonuclease